MVQRVPVQQLTSDEEEIVIEDSDEMQDSDNDQQPKKRGPRAKGSQKVSIPKSPKKAKKTSLTAKQLDTGPALTLDEMVQNSLIYLLLMQHKKVPIKRSEIVKHAMNGQQLTSFPEVMDKIKEILTETFGINLVGIEESKGRIKGYSSYILVSKYPMVATVATTTRGLETDTKRSVLYLILSVIFMLGRSLEEDTIWKILTDLELERLFCKRRDDLHRTLKQEYVSTMYLNLEEIKEPEEVEYRYSWGLRSEKEFSKTAMLKFVAKQFGRQPSDFKTQYEIVQEQEQDMIEADQAGGTDSSQHRHDEQDLEQENLPCQSMNYNNDRTLNLQIAENFHSLSSRSRSRSARDLTTPPPPEDMDTDTE